MPGTRGDFLLYKLTLMGNGTNRRTSVGRCFVHKEIDPRTRHRRTVSTFPLLYPLNAPCRIERPLAADSRRPLVTVALCADSCADICVTSAAARHICRSLFFLVSGQATAAQPSVTSAAARHICR